MGKEDWFVLCGIQGHNWGQGIEATHQEELSSCLENTGLPGTGFHPMRYLPASRVTL